MADANRASNVNEAARFADALAESYRIVYGQAAQAQVRQGRLAREFSERVMENLRKQTEEGRAASEQLADQARRQGEAGRAGVGRHLPGFPRHRLLPVPGGGAANRGEHPGGGAHGLPNRHRRGRLDNGRGSGRDANRGGSRHGATADRRGYDEMTVDEVTRRLEGLSGEELGRVREYERRNKNRTTLLEQIDRKADEAS